MTVSAVEGFLHDVFCQSEVVGAKDTRDCANHVAPFVPKQMLDQFYLPVQPWERRALSANRSSLFPIRIVLELALVVEDHGSALIPSEDGPIGQPPVIGIRDPMEVAGLRG